MIAVRWPCAMSAIGAFLYRRGKTVLGMGDRSAIVS
jgi:hypothetical protein